MANWREIIISGSDADLRSVSSSLATIETALTSSGTTKLNLGTDVGVTDIVVAAADGTLYRNDSLGLKGQKGEIGTQGTIGDLGGKGDVGPQGAIGTQGTNGTKGATGDKLSFLNFFLLFNEGILFNNLQIPSIMSSI